MSDSKSHIEWSDEDGYGGDRQSVPEQTECSEELADERPFSPLRAIAGAGGLGLVLTYTMSWVEVDGPTETGTSSGTISASEVLAVPEVVAGFGFVTLAIALVRWNRWTQLGVLVVGLVGTGMTLFLRFFLGSDGQLIEVGDTIGPPESFDPALGLTAALALSLVLVGTSFLAILRTFDDDGPATRGR